MFAPSSAGLLACFWILLSFAGILITARLWLRLHLQRQSLVAADVLIVIAWCGSLTHAVFVVVFAREGALDPSIDYTLTNWAVPIEKIEYVTRMVWASVLPFFTSLYFCKFALLATYWQLFPNFMKKLRLFLYITIAFCVSGYLVSMCLQLFLCWPIEGNWSFASNPAVVCNPKIIAIIFYVAWSLHFTANFCILVMPFFVVRGIQVKKPVLIGIYAIFCLGFVDMAFSLTRFFMIHLNSGSFKPLTMIQLWSILDENMALIIACLPSLRPYLRRGFLASSTGPSYAYGGRTTGNVTGTAKSRTPAAGGFEMMSENHRSRIDRDDDAWSDGKKSNSNRSDIELVTVQAQWGNKTEQQVPDGRIRVETEFHVRN